MQNDIEQKMQVIVEQLNDWAYKYYVLDEPVVADAEYDKIYDELCRLEKESGIVLDNSPTKRVGGEILNGFKPYYHKARLYSLDKCQNETELKEWFARTQKIVGQQFDCCIEYKFDGLTLVMTYDNGKLIRGATRGNGTKGEDVTEQIKTIKSLPLTIPYKGYVEVQGEGIMRLSALEKYNQTAKEPLKNARNGVAGAIRNLDPKVTASRNLDIMCYNVNYIEGKSFSNQQKIHQFLQENRFKTSTFFKQAKGFDDIFAAICEVEASRPTLDYLIDGAVVKTNSIQLRDEMGYTEKFPRWAVAYKFKAEEATTVLNDIVWQVSRTGKLNPIALLEPVDIGGVTVKRATLNNFFDIERKKIKIGARVFIRRSNDVIPEITGVAEYYDDNKPIEKPTVCPSCGGEIVEEGAFLKCKNKDCTPSIIALLTHFVSKDAMDIDGLSERTIELLFSEREVADAAMLYDLTAEDFEGIEGFKDKKITKLLSSIQNSKNTTLDRFLYALGIPNIGKKSARMIADTFRSLEAVKQASVDEIVKIEDFGAIMAQSVYDFFRCEKNLHLIDRLLKNGIAIEVKESTEGVFSGMKIVLTGSMEKYSRSEAQKLIEERGGELAGSISKSVDLLIVGANAGSKLEKAEKLGIKIIDEQQFLNLL